MCGIAGILRRSKAFGSDPLLALHSMTAALWHRGPDGEGYWCDRQAGIALGHRRLAIIDLTEAGHQPMLCAEARYVITFNGEIYNFTELRSELEGQGVRFRGSSDTEIMLAAITGWGLEAALARFAGMFAFALWDRKARTLHFARDRLGKKPLYIAVTRDALAFASELKAIRELPGFAAELDETAAATMLTRGWVPDHHCIWKGVFKLPPGAMLSVSPHDITGPASVGDLKSRVRHWWRLADIAMRGREDPAKGSDEELADRLDELLRLAVRQRMIADVPLGSFLSGGIDSSLVVALMQAQSTKPVRTFTIAFADSRFDESSHASAVARYLGTDHSEHRLTPQAARDVIPELPRIWDEPFADESQIPTLLVSRLAREHVTVALTGDGGDEGFAGYARHFLAARLSLIQNLGWPLRRASGTCLSLLARGAQSAVAAGLPVSGRWQHALRSDRLQRLAHVLAAPSGAEFYLRLSGRAGSGLMAAEAYGPEPIDLPDDDVVSRLLHEDATGYLPGDILVKLDRASMAVSLEARCPLLDHRVIEFAWQLPLTAKIRHGHGKWLLRRLLARYVPPELFNRPKQGFDVPVGAWLRGPLHEWASDLVADLCSQDDGFIDHARLETHWREHINGSRDHSSALWSLLMFQAWRNHASETVTGREGWPKQTALAGE